MTDDDIIDDTAVVGSLDDLRALSGQDGLDDLADWIWSESDTDVDIGLEDLGHGLNVILNSRIGVALDYPFTLGDLWTALEDSEAEAVEHEDDDED